MTMGQLRARLEDEKAVRRTAILEAAVTLWQETGFAAFHMADLAKRAGLAKGTLYIYFSTKEHLFFALVDTRLHAWMQAVQAGLAKLRNAGAKEVSRIVCRTFEADPLLDRMLPLLENTLEPATPEEVRSDFRLRSAEGATALAGALESAMPDLQKGQGLEAYSMIRIVHAGYRLTSTSAEPAGLETALAHALRGVARKKHKKKK
jgi:AcrR family transcriptional regulator